MGSWRDLAAPIALAACLALLAVPALEPRGPLSFAGLAALRTSRDLSAFAIRLAAWGALELLRSAPLGFLAVLVFRDRARRRDRALRVALPAAALALGGAALAMWIAARLSPPEGLVSLRLLLAAGGVAVGLGAALAWRRGRPALVRFALQLLATAGVLFGVGGAVAALAIEREPRAPVLPPIGSADKRRLFELLRGKNPRKVPAGETRSVHLTDADLDRLSAWGSAITRRGYGLVRTEGSDTLSAEASLQLPWPRGRWLNVATRLRVGVEQGRLDLVVLALRVGRITVPGRVLELLSPVLVHELTAEPRIRLALPAVQLLRIDPGGATATWGRVEIPKGTLSGLMWGDDLSGVRAQVSAYVARLLETLPRAPPGDPRFAAALDAAFALARERSRGASALEENRAALIALGIVLGHPRISAIIGEPLDGGRVHRIGAVRMPATVRGRNDWVRHFTVSGALVALSWDSPSNAAGLFKEERDAAGGSGFSFGDLLADRAGTTFADAATRDEASAVQMQERLARGVRIEDLFPPAADLPEDIPDADLQRRYGGVGGPLFRRYAEEIERRVASCAAYRR